MKQKIAVLGAGPMGLAVAYQLTLDGHQPILFEADDRIGGMTASFNFNGLEIERYYHFHCISDYAFLQILKELGIFDKMHWVETKMGYWYRDQVQPWGNPAALLKFKGISLIAKLRYGLHAFLSTKRNNWKSLDRQNAITWIRRWVGVEAYDALWSKLFDYKFYHYSNDLSAAWIWSRIRRIGRSRYNIFREKLGYLEGGSNTLLIAMKAAIEAKGGVINLKSPVNKVVIQAEQVRGIEVNARFEPFDKVISTVPLPYVPQMIPNLPPEILTKYQSVKNIAVVCVIVKLHKVLTENFWLNVNDDGMDIPGIVEYTNLRPLGQNIIYIPFYMPNEHPNYSDSDQIFLNKAKSYLKKINSNLKDEDFIEMKASRYRYAQPVCSPSHLNNLPQIALPVKGLWVADTSYYYPEDRGISESINLGRKIAREAST